MIQENSTAYHGNEMIVNTYELNVVYPKLFDSISHSRWYFADFVAHHDALVATILMEFEARCGRY